MKTKTFKQWLAGASIALLLAACGGGGGGSADGGIGGTGGGGNGGNNPTGVSYGTITAFGSVWVNGVEFKTTDTTFKTEDNPNAGQDDLRIGMVVRVDGSIANATATTITVDDAVKGRVEAVQANGSLVVMGQVIQIDANTTFDNGVRPAQGDLVHVHGLVAGDGVIAAGYVEKKTTPSTPPFAVKGLVKSHDTAAQTFQVGTLTVRYAGATVSDMPASGSWNGLEVEAKGSTCAGTPVCGTLTASKVEPAGVKVDSASEAEYEGIVTTLAASGFTIGNQSVVTTASTVYEGGTAADVLVGTKVEAEGSITNGVLTATKVSIRDGVRIEADVATVNAAAGTFTLNGLPGVTVSISSATQLKDLSGIGDLAPGNHLRLRGRPGADNAVVATELELRSSNSDSRVELRAVVQAETGNTLTLQGVAIDLGSLSDDSFQDVSGAVIGKAAFFTQVKVGSLVKVRGDLAGGGVSWSEAEIESD